MVNQNARQLRRDSTDAERRLWEALRDRRLAGYRFRRQHPVGGFILDFACTRHCLAVEADGGQHADSLADVRRTMLLQRKGWRVLRFWNNDVLGNTEGVIEAILSALPEQRTLTRSRTASAITLSRGAGEGLSGRPGEGCHRVLERD
jgi:very-short-patch-repair endonuclease